MTSKLKKSSDAKSKSQKRAKSQQRPELDDFVSVARRLEADEDKGRFEAKLTMIAKRSKSESAR